MWQALDKIEYFISQQLSGDNNWLIVVNYREYSLFLFKFNVPGRWGVFEGFWSLKKNPQKSKHLL